MGKRLNGWGRDGPGGPGEINRLAETSGTDDMVVLLGQPDANSAGLFAETVTRGDPTWAGPLAGVPL